MINLVNENFQNDFGTVANGIIEQLQAFEFTKEAKNMLLKILKKAIQVHRVEKAHKMTVEEAYKLLSDLDW